ncbi:hypothetical protein DFH09DRAFT_1331146 [Mycena vulgaris]|nr:hypothetical protein DFH09DRAFT_1331146 [Mycena vulgaris]
MAPPANKRRDTATSAPVFIKGPGKPNSSTAVGPTADDTDAPDAPDDESVSTGTRRKATTKPSSETKVTKRPRRAKADAKNKGGTDDDDYEDEDVQDKPKKADKPEPGDKPKAKRGPRKTAPKATAAAPAATASLPGNVAIAADALQAQWRADLDLALAHRQAEADEAKTVAYETIAVLFARAIDYIDLATFDLRTRMEAEGTLSPQLVEGFKLSSPTASAPPLPAPFKSLWLSGKTIKGPMQDGEEPEPSAAGPGMLEGDPTLLSDDD